MKVSALAGGGGGAKLLLGLQRVAGGDLTGIVNTADDATIYGVHVSPDVDIVTYWLAGMADTDRGWGISGDTFTVVEALRKLVGDEAWFNLGDRDLATCIYRTQRLAVGARLSEVTAQITAALGVRAHVLPMSDDPVATIITTTDDRLLDFQRYFVRERHQPEVAAVHFEGISDARPAPGVLEAIANAETVIVGPSNPVVSVGPIVGLPGVRDALRTHPQVIAVTPIVGGAALKGPADRMLTSLGTPSSASGVASLYADFVDAFVVDASDVAEADKIEALGIRAVVLDTIMTDADASERLARLLLQA